MAMGSNPFKEIERILERMGRQVEADLPVEMQRGVAVDVADHGDRFGVSVDMPGFEKEDIDLTLIDRTLQIDAEREIEREEHGETGGMAGEEGTDESVPGEAVRVGEDQPRGVSYIRKERRRQSISRSIELPESVDEEAVEATLSNGVLTVTLPKRSPEAGGREIDIE